MLNAVEQGRVVSYGKALTFLHRKEAFAPEAQQLLAVLRRQQSVRESLEQNLQKLRGYATAARSPGGRRHGPERRGAGRAGPSL